MDSPDQEYTFKPQKGLSLAESQEPCPPVFRIPGVRFRKWVTVAAMAAGVIAVAAISASAVFCESALRVPRRVGEFSVPAGHWQTATIRAADGAALRGWFATPTGKTGDGCVMVLHGIADSHLGSAGFAPMFLAEGYSVLLPDSRAHGTSGGSLVTYGLLEKHDALRWARWMRAQGCGRIYGLGESLGASILIQAAAVEPQFRAIAAECPYADLEAIAESRVQDALPLPGAPGRMFSRLVVRGGMLYARLRYGLDLRAVSPTAAIAQTNTPVLLIHGLEDRRTPPWHSRRLAEANPRAALWLVPDADHVAASAAEPVGFRTRVLGWFRQH
jgi:pimeloyl-ACP methyl ester carboxylesterase